MCVCSLSPSFSFSLSKVGVMKPFGRVLSLRGSSVFHARRFNTTTASPKSGAFSWLKYGPRSRAELGGLVLGASVFPISVALMMWYESRKLAPPELAPEFNSMESVTMSPKDTLGGPFKVRDSKTGEYITDKELFEDHWTLLYFGFSKCAEVCPTTLQFLAEALKKCDEAYGEDPELQAESKRLQAAFLSVDFIRDSPDVVQRFVSKYEARIRGLCGTRQEIEQAARVWRVYYSSVDETDEEREAREAKGVEAPVIDDTFQFDHSSAIYFVGPDGKMKDFFFKEMGVDDLVDRIGIHFSDIYGFRDTRAV